MNFPQAMEAIDALKPSGMLMGLERMRLLLDLLGNPQDKLSVVHVAGTNGKGSTARMIQCMATAAGWKTGLYASPAVTGIRDTITVDGQPIPEQTFAELTARILALQPRLEEVGGLSEFELTTALALAYFAEAGTQLCVVECGLGGRDDATNVIGPPLLAVLTPMALDHTAMLGNTLEEIAANKCGILKSPAGVVAAPGQPPEALGVVLETAARRGLTVYTPNPAAAALLEEELGCLRFFYGGTVYTLPLTGAFQMENALTALEAARLLGMRGYPIPAQACVSGLAAATMPCRQEVVRRSPLLMMDGAHNPHGVAALRASLMKHLPGAPLTMVIGMLRDKNTAACAALLAPLCSRIICCTPDNARALEAEALAAQMREHCARVEAVPDPNEALKAALQEAGNAPVLVAGSFYLCAQLRPQLVP